MFCVVVFYLSLEVGREVINIGYVVIYCGCIEVVEKRVFDFF